MSDIPVTTYDWSDRGMDRNYHGEGSWVSFDSYRDLHWKVKDLKNEIKKLKAENKSIQDRGYDAYIKTKQGNHTHE